MEDDPTKDQLSPLQRITFAASDLLNAKEWSPYIQNKTYEYRQISKDLDGGRILNVTQMRIAGQDDVMSCHVQVTSPDVNVLVEHGLNAHWRPVDETRGNIDIDEVEKVLIEASSESS